MRRGLRRWAIVAISGILLIACGKAPHGPGGSGDDGGIGSGPISGDAIKVLSNRADLISGGDALIEVALPADAVASTAQVELNGNNVTTEFGVNGEGRYMGVLTGLEPGRNVVKVSLPGGASSSYAIINHPTGGPILSGPQVQPWTCQPGALDAQCNQPATYRYSYKSTRLLQSGLQPYDPVDPPTDVATTTTDQGVTVPFIVRVETGYQDRDQYQIAVLFQPGHPWSGPDPQPQFNRKLLITHGASCDVDYSTGTAPDVTSYNSLNLLEGLGVPVSVLPFSPVPDSVIYALGAGFAVMSTALDNSGHDCNVAIQAESLVMAKEHLVESYGTLRYTIGTGCSGGSLAQQWIANAYPGVYQGILPTCSFPDAWTSGTQVMDYHLLNAYFGPLATGIGGTAGTVWIPLQAAAVEGNLLPVDSLVSDAGFFGAIEPTHLCGGVTPEQVYDPHTNPAGVRCSIADLGINVFGPRLPAVWSANESSLGHGFAGIAVDNVGVQYGLSALQKGLITPAMFLDLNTRIGGLDVDIGPTPHRIAADEPALSNAYRSGMINEANNLGQTAIIDCLGPDPGLAHDSYRTFAVRARLDRENGTHANQLIWGGPIPIIGDASCNQTSLVAMDRWLAAIERDTANVPVAQKIIADKPADLGDQCWDGIGNPLFQGLCGNLIVPVYGTPRTVAGDALTTDTNKCQRKPLDRADDYGLIPFSEAQWTQMQGLFADGVCDFGKPGVSQQPTIPWQSYQDDDGNVVYGGQPLPLAPADSGSGWAGASFHPFSGGP